ncbi:MAG: UvrD-helicase domain-containing protein [Flavobacteriales bacterium Tduv]
MLSPGVLKIYNASAGSGKTYTLVLEYLSVLLQEDDPYLFRNILAVTFTNKAAKEMKDRLLQSLKILVGGKVTLLSRNLSESLNLSCEQLQRRAGSVLKAVLHDYSNFSVSTIDKFNHKIIRTFTSDLGISQSFEVEMETKRLLGEAVEVLLSELNDSEKSSQILIQFALDKLDDGDNWDPSRDLMKISSLLVEEQSISPLKKLKYRSLDDFLSLSKLFECQIRQIKTEFKVQADCFFDLLQEVGISRKSFYYSDLPNFFNKLSNGRIFEDSKQRCFENPFNKRLLESIASGRFYSKFLEADQKELIDTRTKQWITAYNTAVYAYSEHMPRYMLVHLLKKNSTLLATIHELDRALETLKKDNNILLNAELNKLISCEIHGQPLPYLYERLGEHYLHYFIDEFQDTSHLQWYNLQPLVENALAENGTTLLVGDAKQSIYRWRGGHAEQFIELLDQSSKVYIKEVETLGINFRSCEQVIRFNNALYISAAQTLDDVAHQKIYSETTVQQALGKPGGYVELNFLYKDQIYFEQTYQSLKTRVKALLDQDYQLADIAVLVRKNEEGSFLAQAFSRDGMEVCSCESLLLKNAWPVQYLIGLFRILANPDDHEARVDWLLLLVKNRRITIFEDVHDFLLEMSDLPSKSFFEKLNAYGLSFERLPELIPSLYDLAEMAVRAIRLERDSHMAEVQFFLDFVFRSVQRSGNSVLRFLEYWETRKGKESIVSSEKIDAIRIMTIHKSKGLQFPVVLLAFFHWSAFKEREAGAWLDIDPQAFNGFDTFYVTIRPFMPRIGGEVRKLYEEHSAKVRFDNLNLLYVSTTRAVEQLFVFVCEEGNKKETIAFYIKNYLLRENIWVEGQQRYAFGTSQKKGSDQGENSLLQETIRWVSEPWLSRVPFRSILYESANREMHRKEARLSGELVHEALSMIYFASDLKKALQKLCAEVDLNDQEYLRLKKQLLRVVDHTELKRYYQVGCRVFSERELIFEGKCFRPDRVIFFPEETIVMDYKTGATDEKHHEQVGEYIRALSAIGHPAVKGLLVYIDEEIKIISFDGKR